MAGLSRLDPLGPSGGAPDCRCLADQTQRRHSVDRSRTDRTGASGAVAAVARLNTGDLWRMGEAAAAARKALEHFDGLEHLAEATLAATLHDRYGSYVCTCMNLLNVCLWATSHTNKDVGACENA